MTSSRIKRYGWRKQNPDPRDYQFGLAEKVFTSAQLPAKFSLRDQFPLPVFDQLQIGSCVPNHVVENVIFRAMKEGRQFPMLSRLFVYAKGRDLEGTPLTVDSGMVVRDGCKVFQQFGAPPETEMPYSDQAPAWQQEPSQQAVLDAVKFEALEYKFVDPKGPGCPMRSSIYQGMPISFGFPVPTMFEDPAWNPATTPLPLPDAKTQWTNEGHCENVIGWDFTLTRFSVPAFEIRNSWSSNWGDAGHHWMDYRWFDGRNMASDLCVITKTS